MAHSTELARMFRIEAKETGIKMLFICKSIFGAQIDPFVREYLSDPNRFLGLIAFQLDSNLSKRSDRR